MMKLNIYQKICLGFFFLVITFQIGIAIAGLKEGFYNNIYAFLLGITPIIAGIIAMRKFQIWSGFKSSNGKAVFFIGLGIFCWGVGAMIWFYYNSFLNILVPYPSVSDLFFLPGVLFYIFGTIHLSAATGVRFGLKSTYAKISVALVSLLVLAFSYYLLIIFAKGGIFISDRESPLKIILDILYPLLDFMGLLLVIIISGLSIKYLGGEYKYDIFAILLGIGVMFVGDVAFSYTTTMGTYYNANFADFSFTIGTFLISFGVLGFCKLKSDLSR